MKPCCSRVLLAGSIVAGSLASALAQAQLDGWTLGHIETVVRFCSEVEPQQTSKYEQRLKAATDNASEADIAKARKTREYEQAREAVREELARMPKEKAGEACRSALES